MAQAPAGWAHLPIRRIEDLRDAVYGAGLEAIQLSSAPLKASLVFGAHEDMIIGSGHIDGRVILNGPLSQDQVTFGLGLAVPGGTTHWMRDLVDGSIGVFMPGDESEAIYMPGSFYTTLTIPLHSLEERAARAGMVLDERTLGGTGFSDRNFDLATTLALRRLFERVHTRPDAVNFGPDALGEAMIEALIGHYAREPRPLVEGGMRDSHARIVRRAREFIAENLGEPISLDAIAGAAATSHRSLHRAFQSILNETPHSYVHKLRLYRIRRDLASPREAVCTITQLAGRWGIGELGRFAGTYRKHFGELPSQTRRALAEVDETLALPSDWQDSHSH